MLSFNAVAEIIQGSKTFKTTKSSIEFMGRLANLEGIKDLDDEFEFTIPSMDFIKIRALDMIKSQVIDRDGHRYLLLEFRPLPKNTDLEVKYYPRIILECSESPNALACKTSERFISKARILKKFDFTISYIELVEPNEFQGKLSLTYDLIIDDDEYDTMKDEALSQMIGDFGNILSGFADQILDPRIFFENYIIQLYKKW